MNLFTGVGVALVTLLDSDGHVDTTAIAELASDLAGRGVRVVLVCGTTGEAATPDECRARRPYRRHPDCGPADIPVLGGTGATTARQVEELQHVDAIPMKTSPITGPSCCLPENLHDGIVVYPQESRSGFLSYGRRKGIWTTHSGEDVTFYFFDLLERVNP